LGFGRKGEQPQSFTTDMTDKEDLQEIKEIAEMLNPNEEVFVVARITQHFRSFRFPDHVCLFSMK